MIDKQRDALYLVLLGAVAFLLIGIALQSANREPLGDFKGIYYEARCALHNCDPYNPSQVETFYIENGGKLPVDAGDRNFFTNVTVGVNLPTTLLLALPLAMLPWGAAQLLWTLINAVVFILASFLVWDIAAEFSPLLSAALIFGCFVTSELFLVLGNPACIVISFCAIAAWCMSRQRCAVLGVTCLALSLVIKPHDSWLVWLCFLVVKSPVRKRALQALILAIALGSASILWMRSVAPHWLPELRSNLIAVSRHGGLNDPGPSSSAGHGMGMVVSLQAIFSEFVDDPKFYDTITFIICGILLAVWLLTALSSRADSDLVWFGLAPAAALTLLPVYHRIYDAKLLLLTVPACAVLWKRGGPVARCACWLSGTGFLLTGGVPWGILLRVMAHIKLQTGQSSRWVLIALQSFTVPVLLFAIAAFYLSVYVRFARLDQSSRVR